LMGGGLPRARMLLSAPGRGLLATWRQQMRGRRRAPRTTVLTLQAMSTRRMASCCSALRRPHSTCVVAAKNPLEARPARTLARKEANALAPLAVQMGVMEEGARGRGPLGVS
jgi:hypothetical protein